ncbi:uncharacterized protein TNCT_659731, partial [Trichonephila clavata]
ETTPEASTRGCKQLITTQYGTFYTPNYPDKYPRYSRCQYIVEKYSPDACEVKLTVHAFEVTRMTFTNCSEDYLEIQDGDKRYRICGDLPQGTKKFVSFPTDSNQLIFNFRSTFHQKKGFEIRVKQLPFSCRRGVTTTLATTRAPANCSRTLSGRQDDLRFPDGVDSTADRCTYTIRRSESRACLLQLDFSTFDVTESADCAQQYLMLPDGQKLCGVLGGSRKFIQFPPNEDEMVITSSGSNKASISCVATSGPCDVTSTSNFTGIDSYEKRKASRRRKL